MRGKIITIEGADATGKKTQTKLLVEKLKEEGFDVETLSFPRYETAIGKVIRAYLLGKFGKLDEINPKIASSLYIADRLDAQLKIASWLNQNKIIVLDRYLESNLAHQAAKVFGKEREKLIRWLYDLEVKYFKIIPSDLVLLLDLPLGEAEKAMMAEERQKDIHESDTAYKMEVHKTYLQAASIFGWHIVDCMSSGKRLSKKEVAEKVWNVVKKFLKTS